MMATIMTPDVSGGGNIRAWMAENPIYYTAFQPAIKCLQQQVEPLPFQEEILFDDWSKKPVYAEKNSKMCIDGGLIFTREGINSSGTTNFNQYVMPVARCCELIEELLHRRQRNRTSGLFNNKSDESPLEDDQLSAILHCLNHRVCLIQGGPGTGKSWLGVRIIRILATVGEYDKQGRLNSKSARFLIKTFKNETLNEMCGDLLDHFPSLIRVGNGGADGPDYDHLDEVQFFYP